MFVHLKGALFRVTQETEKQLISQGKHAHTLSEVELWHLCTRSLQPREVDRFAV